jgi:hypothetical protein
VRYGWARWGGQCLRTIGCRAGAAPKKKLNRPDELLADSQRKAGADGLFVGSMQNTSCSLYASHLHSRRQRALYVETITAAVYFKPVYRLVFKK